MIRRLFPLCLVAALWGCSQPVTPTPSTGGSSSGGSAQTGAGESKGTEAVKEPSAVEVAETSSKPEPKDPMPEPADATPAKPEETAPAEPTPAEPKEEPKEATPEPAPAGDKPEGDKPEGDKPEEPKDEGPKSVDELLASLQQLNAPPDLADLSKKLETLLAKEPEHANGRLTLANIEQLRGRQAGGTESGKDHFLKSAENVRIVMKQNAELAESAGVRGFAGMALYNEACALAFDKKTAESLAALKEAVGYGFADLKLMNADEDLVAVRELPEFAAFVEETKKAIKELNAKEVAKLMETHEPFEFNFELDDINGKKVSKAEFAGKVMIVDIWGTWCPPCRAEIPHFVELDKEFKEKGLQIVGLNREQTKDDEAAVKLVKDFNEQQGVTYPCALITEEIMGQVPEFQGFPTTLFIDRAGKVRLKVVGARGPEFLQAVVELLLAEKAPEAAAN